MYSTIISYLTKETREKNGAVIELPLGESFAHLST
jgi:hypothetical protein